MLYTPTKTLAMSVYQMLSFEGNRILLKNGALMARCGLCTYGLPTMNVWDDQSGEILIAWDFLWGLSKKFSLANYYTDSTVPEKIGLEENN